MSFLKKTSLNNYLLLFVIAVAATIRFWDYSSMQFMHDELSAVIRSQASGFSELIYKTKTTDVHPVGVPVFVHYWTKVFGTNEMIVRLPFIIFGLISIYYSYKIAEKWFNPTVAIFTCAFLATLQFPTMYGQLERPYATGMLFSVLMVWCWTQFFFDEKSKNKYAIGFVLFATLCTYNHYFSLLFAGLVGATGLFFLNKENAKKYVLMCVSVILLFIPHISILLFHLSIGSGGEETWIGKPQPDWLITFLKYLFHYSIYVYAVVGILFLTSFYFFNLPAGQASKEKKVFDKMRIIALIWAILVPCLAYFYSITKTPVLQFSTFTFSLPFLLMFIFSFYAELKAPIKIAVIAIVMIVNTYTLFAERKHFPLFYKHPYEQMAIVSNDAIKKFGDKNVFVGLSAMDRFVDFYFERHGKFDYLNVDGSDIKTFIAKLEKVNTDYFVAGNLNPEFFQVVKEKYPYIISKEEGFTFSIYCFSKKKPTNKTKENIVFSETQNVYKTRFWEKNFIRQDSCMSLDSTQEYSAGFSTYLYEILNSRHSILNVSAEIDTGKDTALNPTLVLSIDDGKEPITWRGSEYNWYSKQKGEKTMVYVSHLFSGLDMKKHPYAHLKVYVWNRDKKKVLVKNLKVEVLESNPRIYGLYEPIE